MFFKEMKRFICSALAAVMCISAAPGVLANETDNTSECVKITADYDNYGRLLDVDIEKITSDKIIYVENTPSHKVFYWESLDSMKPIEVMIPSPSPTISPTVTLPPIPSSTPTVNPSNHWDFKAYSGSAAVDNITESKNETYGYSENSDTLEIGLNSGDSVTEKGVFWSEPSGTKSDSTTSVSNNRYIKYTPSADGILSVTYKGSANANNKHPRIYLSCGNSLDCMTKDANNSQLEENQFFDNNSTDFKTAEFKLSKGKTYYIWSYYYNSTANQFTISDIAFNKAEETVRTRNIYGSNMLLQRNQPVVIDGKADAVDKVTVTLTNETTNTVVQTAECDTVSDSNSWNNKDWSVTLDAVPDYNSTYKLSISAENAETIEYTNILFGDLYLFTGQSNMWKQVSYYKNIDKDAYGETAVAANATDKIRVMHTQGSGDTGTAVLQYDAKNAQPWRDFSTYDNVSDISAPAYTAAIKMHSETGVPIGLITNAYPGSYISSWFDSALKIDACNEGRNKTSNERNWYCGRIYPLRNLKLSGVFWYQGCADAATTYHDNPYEYYSEMMPKLIDTWRELFNNDALPFYYVQLSRIGSTIVDENNPDTGTAGKMPIKRAQTDTYLNMADKTNIGIISTLDLYGNHNADGTANCRNDIHLGQKHIIGDRMAAYALKDIYGKDVYSHGPIYKSSEVKNGKIIVTFDCSGQLKIMPSSQYTDTVGEAKIQSGEIKPDILNEFEIAGADGVWHSAKAEITADNQVTVSCDDVASPVKVRYCGKDYPESPNLTDGSNLPSYVFEKTAENSGSTVETPSPSPSTSPIPTAEPSPIPNITATYKFDFGSSAAADGYTAVTADMVYDMSKTDAVEGYCGFLGTTETSYADDILGYDCDKRAIDGFSLVKGQQILLSNGGEASDTNADSDYITVPSQETYSKWSSYEGRLPIRFSMKADRASYYTVTATLTNSSDTEDACVSLFSEKRQIVAEDVTIHPNEKITFKFNVDIEDVTYKTFSEAFRDDMLNISVSGKNAALSSVIVEKHGKIAGTIKGTVAEGGVNDGVTLWACTDSTGCDCPATVPFFALQNYAGVGQALIKYMPENIAVSNQGERGLATGDNAHFDKCNLKQGDYLYVEYGHNDSGADSYKKNLEKYYIRAHNSGAKLIIVSPVNRHNNYSNGKWNSDFTAYIEAADAFVKEKIDAGADDIAFVDMNTLYVDWMNRETERIKKINPSLDEQGAMSFYYRSVKGSKVDGTHMNDAGADQAAYYFFEAARNIVAAADNGSEDKYVKAQAEIVRPIADGMKTKIGDSELENLPMTVSDEIINAGKAPNSYWDTVPSDALEYVNSTAVDGVGAVTSKDGSMAVSSVDMRIMNSDLTYAKAIVTVNHNGAETKYYTESNYDCTGDEAGTVKTNTGFITSDKDHNTVTDSDRIAAIIVPDGADCTVQIVSCDDKWVVGDNPTAYSTVYNVYPELETVFDENGASADGWTRSTGASDCSETVNEDTDGSQYITILSNNADTSGTKKNYGFYKALDNEISAGRYRLSFKTRLNTGVIRFALANSVGNGSNPFPNKIYALCIENGSVYVNNKANTIPVCINEEIKESKINIGQWINIDAILNLDAGTISISAAGSDYTEFAISDWQSNAPTALPIKYFGVAGSGDATATDADIKDMRIVKIPQGKTEKVNASASAADNTQGTVLINGENVQSVQADMGASVTFKATANNGFKFVNWTDANGNELSQSAEYTTRVFDDISLTANFEETASGEIIWNFSEYSGENIVNGTSVGSNQETENVDYSGLKIHLNDGDSVSGGGIYWKAPSHIAASVVSNNRYITYTPSENGKIAITFKGSVNDGTKRVPRMYIVAGENTSVMNKTGVSADAKSANTDTTLSADLTSGSTYYIYSFYNNKTDCAFTISNITFTPSAE